MASSTEREVRLETLMPLIRERLAMGQSVSFSPRGVSMLPMLRQGRDTVELSPLPERLKRYDLPLYERYAGKYVLHRVIEVGETYTMMGDNQFAPEPGLRHEQMIALVTAFTRDGRRIEVSALSYRIYCRFWCFSRPIRHFWRRGVGKIRRILRRDKK